MKNKLIVSLIILVCFFVTNSNIPVDCTNRNDNLILSCTWLKSSFGVNQNAIFAWNIQELLQGERPTLHLVWKGGRGLNPEAVISSDGKCMAISTWNKERDAQNILLVDLKTKKEDWLTKDFSEQFFIHWLNNELLLIYNVPHKPNGKLSIQIWNIKTKKITKEIDTNSLIVVPKNSQINMIQFAPSEINNRLIFITWIQESKFKEYNKNNEKVLYLPTYPYKIVWFDKNNLEIIDTTLYPAINNLPYPPRQHFDIAPNGIFAFITDIQSIKEASYPEKNLIRVMKLNRNKNSFETLFTISSTNSVVQYDSVNFFGNNYLIFSEKEVKNKKVKYNVAVYSIKDQKMYKFEPIWNGKNIALVSHKVVPKEISLNSLIKK
ncbi:hypothetical protein [Caldicellulosiruptor acetigenus]|uniref:hypothetical protein n=1 Tax=Caldicellulosiruptor acetigenus TaxID=301953 RepID=UPI0003FAA51A|nr:hypothetical protein [Caldicellulosiruptor acetigenus]WAM35061.1 hypothetical protein OTK01_001379 [Caldicellulosiruptor acetigenus]